MSEKIRKQNLKKNPYLRSPEAWHCAAQLAGPADWLAPVVLHLPPGGQRRVAGACAPPCRHDTCLPVLPLDAWTSGTSPRAAPHRSHSLSLALLLSPCSLSLTREPPPPPTGITVATGLP